jgi:hypothetical protein
MNNYTNWIKDKMSVGLRRKSTIKLKKNEKSIDILIFNNVIEKDSYHVQYIGRKHSFSKDVFEYCKKHGYDIQDITWYWNPFGKYWYQVQKINYDY